MKDLTHAERNIIARQLEVGHDLEDIMDIHPDTNIYVVFENEGFVVSDDVIDCHWTKEELERRCSRTDTQYRIEKIPFERIRDYENKDTPYMLYRLESNIIDVRREIINSLSTIDALYDELKSKFGNDIPNLQQNVKRCLHITKNYQKIFPNDLTEMPEYFFDNLCIVEWLCVKNREGK